MPKVPDNVLPFQPMPQVDPTTLAIAAAMMHQEGKLPSLFDPEQMGPPQRFSAGDKTPNQRVMEGHQEFEQGYSQRGEWGSYRNWINSRGQILGGYAT